MGWLKQPYMTRAYNSDVQATEARFLSGLEGLGIQAQSNRGPDGTVSIVAHCLTVCLDMWLWRCWSDRVEIDLRAVSPAGTLVTVAAIPNLRRTGLRAGERLMDRATLLGAFQPM